jgi:hypothetical protein
MPVSKLLVLAAFVVAVVIAVLILLTTSTLTAITAIGWIAVALALYFAAALVP